MEFENSYLFIKHLGLTYGFDPEKEYVKFCKTLKFRKANPLAQFIDELSVAMGVDPEVLRSPIRKREVVYPRQIIMYILWKENISLTRIGSNLGWRDHSTVINGRDNILDWIEANDKLILRYFKMIEHIWKLDVEHPNKTPIIGERSSL
jgi:hypothetical protein